MKRIAIFTNDLHVGGIQKSVVNLLNRIDYKKNEVDLYLFDDEKFFNITNKVNIIYLKKPPKICKFIFFNIVKRFIKFNFNNKEYDVSIDFDSYQMHTAIGALTCNAKKKVIWVHNDIKIKLKEELKYRILHFFFKNKYKYFDAYCAVSKGALDSFKELYNYRNKEYMVIPNYINTDEIKEKAKEKANLVVDNKKLNIVSVGRLCHQKGYDIMLDNIKELTKYRKDFHLYLIGDGPSKQDLEKQINKLEINEYVTFLGNQKNPFKYLTLMDLFYLSSRYEGQGMVILEALCVGLDVLIPEHLEKYCPEAKGVKNVIDVLKVAKKKQKKSFNPLNEYNDNISKELEKLFDNN